MSSKGWTRFFGIFFIIVIVKLALSLLYSPSLNLLPKESSYKHSGNTAYQVSQKDSVNIEQNDTVYDEVNTKDSIRAKGLNMNLYVPNSWDVLNAYNTANDLIGQYIHAVNDSLTVGLSVHIDKVAYLMTPELIADFTTEKFLIKSSNLKGTLFSRNLVTIDGVKGVQISSKDVQKQLTSYYHIYRLFKNHYAVTFTYGVLSTNEEYATKMFNEYKPLLDRLANKTKFLN